METIKKESVEEIIRWGVEQGHIKGDIELIINTIYSHNDENKK